MRSLLVFLAALLTGGTAAAVDLYAAGSSIFRIDSATGHLLATSKPLDTQATDLEVDPHGRYIAVTTSSGLFLHQPDDLAPIDSLIIGILDGVEVAPDGERIYVLLHPGSDRKSVRGAHQLYVIPFTSPLVPRKLAELSPRNYDLFLSRDEKYLLVTNIMGREVEIVDLTTEQTSRLLVQTPEVRANQMAVLRSAVFHPDGRTVYIGESARGRALILWRLDLTDWTFTMHPLPHSMSALTLVSAANNELIVNGMNAFLRVGLGDMTVVDLQDLHRSAWHAVSDQSNGVFFVAPAEDGARVLHAKDGAAAEFASLPARATRLALGPSPSPE